MRLHIELEDDLIQKIDRLAGPRGRSRFIRDAIGSALDHHEQMDLLRSARGTIGRDHEWDSDPAKWVRQQRRADRRKVG